MSEPRAPTDSKIKEEILKKYREGTGPKALSEESGISINTIKTWIKRDKESAHSKGKKGSPSKAKKCAPSKAKKGGQPNNQNAKGHGAVKGNSNTIKHGAYSDPHLRVLDDDEKELLSEVSDDEEVLMMQQIQFYTIRENRIMKAINQYRQQPGPVALYGTTREEDKRSFKDDEEKEEYERRRQEKIDSGDRMPGNQYHITTVMDNKDNIIARLEKELTSVMRAKDSCIAKLLDIRQKKQAMRHEEELHPYNLELIDARIEQMDAATQRMLGENIEMEDTSDADAMLYGVSETGGNDGKKEA